MYFTSYLNFLGCSATPKKCYRSPETEREQILEHKIGRKFTWVKRDCLVWWNQLVDFSVGLTKFLSQACLIIVPWEWLPSRKLPLKREKRRLSSLSALRARIYKTRHRIQNLIKKGLKQLSAPTERKSIQGCISTFSSGAPFDMEKLSQFPFKNGHSRRNFLPASRPIITSKEVLNMYFPPAAAVRKFHHGK